MADTFIFRKEWLDSISELPISQQDQIISEFVRYGAGIELQHEDDPVVKSFVNMVKGRLDYSIDAYNKKVEASKTAGRKKKIDDKQIYDLAKEGKSATQIADILNCSKSAVDHSEGWRRRKEIDVQDFVF